MMLPDLTFQEISFRSGDVLTKEMLDITYAYPRTFFQLRYHDYGDGVLYGLNYEQKENRHIYLTPGIVKWQNKYFFLQKEYDLTEKLLQREQKTQQMLYFLLVPDVTEQKTVLHLQVTAQEDAGIELGRCAYQTGLLPDLPNFAEKSLSELKTCWQGYAFNVLEVPQAVAGGVTLPAVVWHVMRNLLEQKKHKNSYDYQLLMQLQAQSVLPLPVLHTYLEAVGKPCSSEDRQNLWKQFIRAMKVQEVSTSASARPVTQQAVSEPNQQGPWLL